MNKKYEVIVSRNCYQSNSFTVNSENEVDARRLAEEIAEGYDWGDIVTNDVCIEVVSVEELLPEQQVLIIFGEMEFKDDTCYVKEEQWRCFAPISKAEEIAETLISEGVYISYVIPDLYTGTIL